MKHLETVGQIGVRTLLVLSGLVVMAAEGTAQRAPGVGFVVALVLFGLAAIPWGRRS